MGQQALGMFIKNVSLRRGTDASSLPGKQRNAKLPFQLLDCRRNAGLADIQLFRRPAHISLAVNLAEILQLRQLHLLSTCLLLYFIGFSHRSQCRGPFRFCNP